MTGFGNGTASHDGFSAHAELRSVNNRYFEFSARLPKYLQPREAEVRELVRRKAQRGKINLTVSVEREGMDADRVSLNVEAARRYWTMLQQLAEELGNTAPLSIDTLFKFSDVFTADESQELDDTEWRLVIEAVTAAADMLAAMRMNEGRELTTDLLTRCASINAAIDAIESISANRVNVVREKLRDRIRLLLASETFDQDRLEMEIVLFADKSDITEEIVRFRSHMKFFGEALEATESEGRKLSFLLQELHREANTIAAKSNDAPISQHVVAIKEELERIREQIQNIE